MANPEQKPFDRSVPRRREQDEQEHPGLALGRDTSRAVFYFAAATASLGDRRHKAPYQTPPDASSARLQNLVCEAFGRDNLLRARNFQAAARSHPALRMSPSSQSLEPAPRPQHACLNELLLRDRP